MARKLLPCLPSQNSKLYKINYSVKQFFLFGNLNLFCYNILIYFKVKIKRLPHF